MHKTIYNYVSVKFSLFKKRYYTLYLMFDIMRTRKPLCVISHCSHHLSSRTLSKNLTFTAQFYVAPILNYI